MAETTTQTESKLRTLTPADLAAYASEKVNIDPNANAFNKPLPVPDGVYIVQISKPVAQGNNDAKPALQGGVDKNQNPYFFGNFDAKIIGTADANISPDVLKGRSKNLRTQRITSFTKTDSKTGTETSEMATLVNCATGGQLGGSINLSELGFAFLQVLDAQAQVGAVLQWQAGHMVDSNRKDPKTGKAYREWEVVSRGMEHFKQADGTYNPVITVDGEELVARAEIVGFVRLS